MSDFHHTSEIVLFEGHQEIEVTVYLECISGSEAPSGTSGPPEFYDPGGAAEFEFVDAEVSVGSDTTRFTSELFWALLGDKAQILYDDAVQAAQDSGEF